MDWLMFAVYMVAVCAAASTGAMYPPGPWYDELDKPTWTPPNWLFPLAWTVLYVIIAYTATVVSGLEGSRLAMAFWSLQLVLNALWTPVFFGLRKLGGAFLVLCLLWTAVMATLIAFYAVQPLMGLLLIPYLIWVSYAGALNAEIWRRAR